MNHQDHNRKACSRHDHRTVPSIPLLGCSLGCQWYPEYYKYMLDNHLDFQDQSSRIRSYIYRIYDLRHLAYSDTDLTLRQSVHQFVDRKFHRPKNLQGHNRTAGMLLGQLYFW
ncbi:GSCOCG00007934001-RA-CDS [Cotesia congregata]|nr:GSCOCG00007934001-RA-CDS [Cotesia congregata]